MQLTLGKRIRVVPVERLDLSATYQVSEVRADKSIRLVQQDEPEIFLDIYPVSGQNTNGPTSPEDESES